ncbi:MAG TPA: 50S ribosomal protein L22 [Candidatus Saccharimonadales bacterium]|nr:50S ribosomal protein L22 [Candidatus Saccharimonadales bacterium]
MEAKAVAKYVRITPRKVGQVLDLIRGQRVENAQHILMFTPKNAARMVAKVLKSAVANATNREEHVDADKLVVRAAMVGPGPTLKRWLPRAQGRATQILKRTCHITVVVSDGKSQ